MPATCCTIVAISGRFLALSSFFLLKALPTYRVKVLPFRCQLQCCNNVAIANDCSLARVIILSQSMSVALESGGLSGAGASGTAAGDSSFSTGGLIAAFKLAVGVGATSGDLWSAHPPGDPAVVEHRLHAVRGQQFQPRLAPECRQDGREIGRASCRERV